MRLRDFAKKKLTSWVTLFLFLFTGLYGQSGTALVRAVETEKSVSESVYTRSSSGSAVNDDSPAVQSSPKVHGVTTPEMDNVTLPVPTEDPVVKRRPFNIQVYNQPALVDGSVYTPVDGSVYTPVDGSVYTPVDGSVYALVDGPDLETVPENVYGLAAPEIPQADKPSGPYLAGTKISLFCATVDAQVYYTTDGSSPLESGVLYTEPITLQQDITLKAAAVKDSVYSEVAVFEYSLQQTILSYWNLGNGGKINSDNQDVFFLGASFTSTRQITTIQYTYSANGSDWFSPEPFRYDSGLENPNSGTWYREVYGDFSDLPDGTYRIKAAATDIEGNTVAGECEVTKDTVPPGEVTGLTAEPNADNTSMVLNWTSPSEDFDHVHLYRFYSYGYEGEGDSSNGYWEDLGEAEGTSYIDSDDVEPYKSYTYRVAAVDNHGNESENPPTVTRAMDGKAITLVEMWLDDDGVVNSYNADYYYVEAYFGAARDIISIDYQISTDGTTWQVPEFERDYELDHDTWDNVWYRTVAMNLVDLPDGQVWIQAIATDIDGNTETIRRQVSKNTVAENVVGLTALPNAANNALVLSWTNPADFEEAEIYRYVYSGSGGYWNYIGYSYGSSFTDTNVYHYKTYYYKVISYDTQWNESLNPPEVVGALITDGPIGFKQWEITNDGKITGSNKSSINISATFVSDQDINSIDYKYSTDGTDWKSIDTFITLENEIQKNTTNLTWKRSIYTDLTGLPDGTYLIQTTAAIAAGDILSVEKSVYKDTTPPANVTGLTASKNTEGSGFVLNWVNPPADFDHAIIQRRPATEEYGWVYLNQSVTGDSYTDTNASAGIAYDYRIFTVDSFGNQSISPYPIVTAVMPVDAPVLISMEPTEGYTTKSTWVDYRARFVDEQEIVSILFEVSTDGVTWTAINANNTTPYESDGIYSISGNWDITRIGEAVYKIRATASDAAGRTALEVRTITIDRLPPLIPANFTAAPGPDGISLSWDHSPEASRYYISRSFADPADGYGDAYWNIYPPYSSYVDTSVQLNKMYLYKIKAYDPIGNVSGYATVFGQCYSGPPITFDAGEKVYTRDSNYTLTGKTEPGATLTVDGNAVSVEEDGSFTFDTILTEGTKIFTVVAASSLGTHTRKQWVVLDTTIPVTASLSPSDNYTMRGQRVEMEVTSWDGAGSGVDRVIFQVTRDDGANWVEIGVLPVSQMNETSYRDDATGKYLPAWNGKFYWDSTAPLDTNGPLGDGSYKFRALAYDKLGNISNGTPVRIWKINNTPPAAPVNLAAAAGVDQVNLTWTANTESDLDNYDAYTIYRSTSPGTLYKLITNVSKSDTSYRDINVKPGITYYYVITANDNVDNKSAYSAEVSSIPQADTEAPVITYTSPGEGGTTGGPTPRVSMNATDNSPHGISTFNFEYSADGGSVWTSMAGYQNGNYYSSGTYNEYKDWQTAGLSSGDYLLRFSAADEAGNTSTVTRSVYLDTFVSAPLNFLAVSGEGTVILTWEPVGDTDFSTYQILRSNLQYGSYSSIYTTYDRFKNTYTDTGGVVGKTYYYKIRCTDNRGNYTYSAIISAKPGDDITPPVVTLINPGDGKETGGPAVQFYAQATDNKAVTNMNGLYSTDHGTTWQDMVLSKSGPYSGGSYYYTNFTWNTEGLSSGEYQVRVTARDAAGNEGSKDVNWTLDKTVSAVVYMNTTPGDGCVGISWEKISDTDANGYLISRSTTPGGPYNVITGYWWYGYWYDTWLPASQTSYTDTGRIPGTTYYYKITSRDTWGNRAVSAEVSGSTLTDEAAPVIQRVAPVGGSTIGGDTSYDLFVYFQDNAGHAGSRAEIKYLTADGWQPVHNYIWGPYSGTDPYFYTEWDLGSLATGNYSVMYTVYDSSGNFATQTVSYQVDRSAPLPPRNLVAMYGSGSISLAWQEPVSADVNRYKVYRANALEGPYSYLATISGRTNVSYTDSSVASGLTYYYKVTALDNFDHEGDPSNIAAAAALVDSIPPSILGIEPADSTVFGAQAQITVRAEDNLILSSVSLRYSTDDGETWADIDTRATIGDPVTFDWSTAPLNGPVLVQAVARDALNNVSDGNTIRRYTIDNQGPAQVTGFVYTPYTTSVLLQWQDVSDQDFQYFRVEKKELTDAAYTNVAMVDDKLGHIVTGLKPETEYWFRVAAYDKLQNRGTSSEELLVKTTADTERPAVTSIAPAPGSFSNEIPLSATAVDNYRVTALTFQVSSDNINWTDLQTVEPDYLSSTVTVHYSWDVSSLPEGLYYVRGIAVDASGNQSTSTVVTQYSIDRSGPAQPTGLAASATTGYITVSWAQGPEQDLAGYKLYRATEEGGPYTLLFERLQALSYRDRQVNPNITYFYKVAAVDAAGNTGPTAGPVSAQLLPDTAAPSIISMAPATGAKLPGNPSIYVLAADEYLLSTVRAEYQEEGSADGVWYLIESREVSNYGQTVVFNWNTSGLTDGQYLVRAVAADQAGNTSEPIVRSYSLNAEPPAKPALSAAGGGWRIDLSWTSGNEADLAGFRLYRSTVMGGPYQLLTETTATGFADTDVKPGIRYYYVVDAVDKYGNINRCGETSAIPTTEDKIGPAAEAGDDMVASMGTEIAFDGTGSTDNDRVDRYVWDFGDGSTGESAQPVHTYVYAGTYTVSLAVYDPAGNFSSPDRLQVTVMPPQEVGSLIVRVLDDVSGAVIPGASVVVQFPDGKTQKTYSNAGGVASLVVKPGDYKVYAYKTDFKPKAVDSSVLVKQQTTATVRLQQGQLVVGELNVRRMTLDEIEAAGIDVNAPENQWVYKYEVHLEFNDMPLEPMEFTLNGMGDFLGAGQEEFSFSFGEGSEAMTACAVPISHPGHPEVRPTIAYLVIPGEARWLKEFFEVGLTLENTADPEFIISGSAATLNLPDGLALAPTRDKQSLQVDLGEIAGGETRQVKWIIRGDKKGEYNLEAEFNGILQPFGDPVQTLFRTKDTFKVWGDDALRMHVETQDEVWRGYPYHIRFGLENVSDVPVYNAALELKDYGKQNYIYSPNQELVKTVRELPAGETLWADYWLIPTIKGELNLENSYILKTGGNATIQTDMTSFTAPAEFTPVSEGGNCGVLVQQNDGFSVDLSWDPVEGAAGYRIYRVRDDLLISGVAEMVYEAGPQTTSLTLLEPYGARDYIVNTMFSDREETRHAITGMSWENRVGAPVITVDPLTIRAGRATELTITVNSGGFPVAEGTVDVGEFSKGVVLNERGQAWVTVEPDSTGQFTVTAYDKAGNVIASQTVTILEAVDDPPAIPTGLDVSSADRQAVLVWNPVNDPDLAGYNVYLMVNGIWTRVNSETVTGTTYTVNGLKFGIPYPFAVTAVDLGGNESGKSAPKSITLIRVPSTIETDLPVAAVAGEAVEFLVSTVSNSDRNDLVRVRVNLQDKTQGSNIDLQYKDAVSGEYYPIPFDGDGVAWFGPQSGFPLADAATELRVVFAKAEVYGCNIETVAIADGTVLAGVRKVIEVTSAYRAPVISDNLPATVLTNTDLDFLVSTAANSDLGTQVRVRVTLADPVRRSDLILNYKGTDGTYQPLVFDDHGITWFGPAGGFPLADTASDFRVSFSEAGRYGYSLELVAMTGGRILARADKGIEVKKPFTAPKITCNLAATTVPGKEEGFGVSTRANSETGTMVRVRVSLADPAQKSYVSLKYVQTDGTSQPMTFDDQGVTWFGPPGGFPLADAVSEFAVTFGKEGTYGYKLEILEQVTGRVLAGSVKSIEVKAEYIPPAITDTLGMRLESGKELAFQVSTSAKSEAGNIVRVKVILKDPVQRADITLKYKEKDGIFQSLSFNDQGITWFGPSGGFPLADATTDFTVTFSRAGSYRYGLEIIETAGGRVLAGTEKSVEVKSRYTAPAISDTLTFRTLTGTEENFTVSTRANSDVGKSARVKVILADSSNGAQVSLSYQETDGTYQPLVFDDQGITWFGPTGGFQLADATTNFRVTFNAPGSYKYTLQIVDAGNDGRVLAQSVRSVEVKPAEAEEDLPPVISDNLSIRVQPGLELGFQVAVQANSSSGRVVRIKVTLAEAAKAANIRLSYQEADGSYQLLTFDGQGAAWFGPPAGFPLADAVTEFKITFAQSGSYLYALEVVDLARGKVLAGAEKCIEVNTAASPFKDVPENYWAVNEIVYLTQNRVLSGKPDGNFRPYDRLTRAELAVILVKALELDVGSVKVWPLSDVPSINWAYKEISTVVAIGLMKGYGNGQFRPDAEVTREELVQVICNALGAGTTHDINVEWDLARFRDRQQISRWAASAVAYAVKAGLVSGVEHDLFEASRSTTRGEAAVLIYKMLQNVEKITSDNPEIRGYAS